MDMLQTDGSVATPRYACVYQNEPLVVFIDDAAPFRGASASGLRAPALCARGGSVDDRRAALSERASLLNWFSEDLAELKGKLATSDFAVRVDNYLSSIREVERQIQRAEATACRQSVARSGSADGNTRRVRRPCKTHV